jgi:hypothetical protein
MNLFSEFPVEYWYESIGGILHELLFELQCEDEFTPKKIKCWLIFKKRGLLTPDHLSLKQTLTNRCNPEGKGNEDER